MYFYYSRGVKQMHVNIEKTQNYYRSAKPEALLCDCIYCKNYYLQIKEAYPAVAAYLASLGIDIKKPFELAPLEADENGILEYVLCQYIVFGSCEGSYRHKIGDVEFRVAPYHPSTDIEEAHFVLEFGPIRLNVILPL
jgi:hypothetical protein